MPDTSQWFVPPPPPVQAGPDAISQLMMQQYMGTPAAAPIIQTMEPRQPDESMPAVAPQRPGTYPGGWAPSPPQNVPAALQQAATQPPASLWQSMSADQQKAAVQGFIDRSKQQADLYKSMQEGRNDSHPWQALGMIGATLGSALFGRAGANAGNIMMDAIKSGATQRENRQNINSKLYEASNKELETYAKFLEGLGKDAREIPEKAAQMAKDYLEGQASLAQANKAYGEALLNPGNKQSLEEHRLHMDKADDARARVSNIIADLLKPKMEAQTEEIKTRTNKLYPSEIKRNEAIANKETGGAYGFKEASKDWHDEITGIDKEVASAQKRVDESQKELDKNMIQYGKYKNSFNPAAQKNATGLEPIIARQKQELEQNKTALANHLQRRSLAMQKRPMLGQKSYAPPAPTGSVPSTAAAAAQTNQAPATQKLMKSQLDALVQRAKQGDAQALFMIQNLQGEPEQVAATPEE